MEFVGNGKKTINYENRKMEITSIDFLTSHTDRKNWLKYMGRSR